ALPPLPADRAHVLALLRDVAPDRLALAPRQRRADSQGALSAPARGAVGSRDAARDVCGDARDPDRAVARVHPRRPGNGLALDPAGGAVRRPRRRRLAARRLRERPLPRRRAHPDGGAPAVVLPDADPVALRRPADARAEPPQAARRAPLGELRRA